MSKTRFLKNMITPTKVEPTENHEAAAASGVWTLGEQLEARRGSVWPETGIANPDTLIENNFSIDLWSGDGSADTTTITNNLNLSGKGGLVWIKKRTAADAHMMIDTARGAAVGLESNSTAVNGDISARGFQFNSDGFQFDTADGQFNASSNTYVGWSFKKAPKFFDIVTYTGNGTAGRTVAHSLNDTVGMIMVKNLSQTDQWSVYHRGADGSAPQNYEFHLDANSARDDQAAWNDTAPTSSVFTVGTEHTNNADGENYVAYLFAHNTGDGAMIKCDRFQGNASGEASVDLGFEPQLVMIKNAESADSWIVYDTMRGYTGSSANGIRIRWDTNAAEAAEAAGGHPNASGFATDGDGPLQNKYYIYMAIRRPNMATITDATEVFAIDAGNGAAPDFTSGFPVDFAFYKEIASGDEFQVHSRLQGPSKALSFDSNNAEDALGGTDISFAFNNGYHAASKGSGYYAYMWKRAKGYFDVVAYTGTGSAKTEAHSLGAAPEMMWVKSRSNAVTWRVYHTGIGETHSLFLDDVTAKSDDDTIWNDTAPTSSVFTVGADNSVNNNNYTYVAFLFATLAGVSKVGSVTHSGSSTDVDCGFSAGARFVLLRRHDDEGNWYVWDSVRGIVAGNDPYFLLDVVTAQVTNTDLIDPLASGFQISGDFTDGDYIFYAIA